GELPRHVDDETRAGAHPYKVHKATQAELDGPALPSRYPFIIGLCQSLNVPILFEQYTREGMMRQAVAYLRVSTKEQGAKGNGLEAQRSAIESFAKSEGFEITSWYQESESGKGTDALERRPQLAE